MYKKRVKAQAVPHPKITNKISKSGNHPTQNENPNTRYTSSHLHTRDYGEPKFIKCNPENLHGLKEF